MAYIVMELLTGRTPPRALERLADRDPLIVTAIVAAVENRQSSADKMSCGCGGFERY